MALTKVTSGLTDLDGGITIDNITIDGTEIDLSSGDLTLDVAGDIILDADGGDWSFNDGGVTIGSLANVSSDFRIRSHVSDKDILFVGNDGGSSVTALTLDMSDAGSAYFNNKVGIGATSAGAKLDVNVNSSTAYSTTGESREDIIIHNTNGSDGSGVNNHSTLGFHVADGATSQGFISYVRTADNTGNFTFSQRTGSSSYAEAMRIDSNGRFLTGITTSTTPELGGSNAIGEFVGSSSGRLNVLRLSNSYTVSSGTASAAILFGAHTNGARDNALIEVQNTANGGDAIEFQIHLRNNTNGMIENFTMRHDGDIHLNQTRSDSHLYIGSQGGAFGGNSSNWMRASSSSLMFNAANQHIFEIGGTNKASITSSGGGGIFSDRDMKENIADIDIGLAEVLQFQPRKFKYKLAADETYGFIAQEVETVVPLIVKDITLPDPDPEANKNTIKTIDTQPIIAALVKSVQEQQEQIETLKQEVEELKGG